MANPANVQPHDRIDTVYNSRVQFPLDYDRDDSASDGEQQHTSSELTDVDNQYGAPKATVQSSFTRNSNCLQSSLTNFTNTDIDQQKDSFVSPRKGRETLRRRSHSRDAVNLIQEREFQDRFVEPKSQESSKLIFRCFSAWSWLQTNQIETLRYMQD